MSQGTVRTRNQGGLVTYTRGGGKELEGLYEKPVVVPAADNNDPAFHAWDSSKVSTSQPLRRSSFWRAEVIEFALII